MSAIDNLLFKATKLLTNVKLHTPNSSILPLSSGRVSSIDEVDLLLEGVPSVYESLDDQSLNQLLKDIYPINQQSGTCTHTNNYIPKDTGQCFNNMEERNPAASNHHEVSTLVPTFEIAKRNELFTSLVILNLRNFSVPENICAEINTPDAATSRIIFQSNFSQRYCFAVRFSPTK